MKTREYRSGWAAYFAGVPRSDANGRGPDWFAGWDDAKAHNEAGS